MKYILFIILLLIPLNSYAVLCQWTTLTNQYYNPSCTYAYPNAMPDSVNCTATCETEPWRGSPSFVYPLVGAGYCTDIVDTTVSVEYGGWSKVYDECSAFYRILVAATACTPSYFLQSSYGSYDLRVWDDNFVLPPYTGEYPTPTINYSESSINLVQDFSNRADVPATEVYVYSNSSFVGTFPNGFNPSSGGLNLSCFNYDFSVVDSVPLDDCHYVGWPSFSFLALEYKGMLGSFEYSVPFDGFFLPDLYDVIAPVVAPFYVDITDNAEVSYSYGSGVGSSFATTDIYPSGLYTVTVYNELWEIIDVQEMSLSVINTYSQALPEDFEVYDLGYNLLGVVGLNSPFLDKFLSSSDIGESLPALLSGCGVISCLELPITINRIVNACPLTFQSAFYVDSYTSLPVSIVPLSVVDGVYTFRDYNNQSGIIDINALDCNSLPVVVFMQGVAPTCSVQGSGGTVKSGRYRGNATKQRLIQKNVGGGYERQINN